MFQNINESTIDSQNYESSNSSRRKIEIFSNIFAKKNIFIYIISIMISMVGITGELSPFSMSILGACLANSIPALGIVIASIIGSIIKFGINGALRIFINGISFNSINVHIKAKIKRK